MNTFARLGIMVCIGLAIGALSTLFLARFASDYYVVEVLHKQSLFELGLAHSDFIQKNYSKAEADLAKVVYLNEISLEVSSSPDAKWPLTFPLGGSAIKYFYSMGTGAPNANMIGLSHAELGWTEEKAGNNDQAQLEYRLAQQALNFDTLEKARIYGKELLEP